MVKLTLYVEGGGDSSSLKTKCRQGFSEFFKKLGIKVSIIACGSRSNAFKDFCKALKMQKKDEYCLLLIDSEIAVNKEGWQHIYQSDNWQKPDKAKEAHLHFMVECMEAWLMADKQTLVNYYGQGFKQAALPQNSNIEMIAKHHLYQGLEKASQETTKGKYSKANHSFELLSRIDANKVINNSSHAKRLYETLQNPSNFL